MNKPYRNITMYTAGYVNLSTQLFICLATCMYVVMYVYTYVTRFVKTCMVYTHLPSIVHRICWGQNKYLKFYVMTINNSSHYKRMRLTSACAYVCMYVCTYVCMYACMHVCMYMYVFMHVCLYVYINTAWAIVQI